MTSSFNRFTTPCLTIALIAMTPLVANGQISNLGPAGMDTPIVHAGVFGLRPDGTIGGSAVDTAAAAGEEIVGTVYLSPCGGLGASSGQLLISASATDVPIV